MPSDAETIPFPKEEVTPPVTKMYFAESISLFKQLLMGFKVTAYILYILIGTVFFLELISKNLTPLKKSEYRFNFAQ